MDVFSSKVDSWLVLLVTLAILGSLASAYASFAAATRTGFFSALVVLLVGVLLPAWLLLSTKYLVSAQELMIHSGPFTWKVPLKSITSVEATRSMLSSPALSLDRLAIRYDNGKRKVLVSPEKRQEFLAAIGAPAL